MALEWSAEVGPGGWTQLKNVRTGWCMDDSAAYELRAIGCNGQNYQLWY